MSLAELFGSMAGQPISIHLNSGLLVKGIVGAVGSDFVALQLHHNPGEFSIFPFTSIASIEAVGADRLKAGATKV